MQVIITKLKPILLVTTGICLLTLFLVLPTSTSAIGDASKSEVCQSIGANASCVSGGTSINTIITVAINIISIGVGIIAVIMVILAGFKYITSGGDSAKVTSAKNSLMYAVIGLVIVALAQVIVQFVLAKATGTSTAPPTPPKKKTSVLVLPQNEYSKAALLYKIG